MLFQNKHIFLMNDITHLDFTRISTKEDENVKKEDEFFTSRVLPWGFHALEQHRGTVSSVALLQEWLLRC